MKRKQIVFSLIIIFACFSSFASAVIVSNSALKKSYNVSFALQSGYEENSTELIEIQNIVNALPKKGAIDKITFYRCDINKFKEFDISSIDYNNTIFADNSKSVLCSQINFDSFFECCFKNHVPISRFDKIYVFNSSEISDEDILDEGYNSYNVYHNIEIIKQYMKSDKNEFILNGNIAILYFSKAVEKQSFCDTIGNYIAKHSSELVPQIIGLGQAIKTTLQGSFNAYKISWKNISVFSSYEVNFDGIKFGIQPDSVYDGYRMNVQLQNAGVYSYINKDIITCYIKDAELGAKCVLFGYGKNGDDPTCPECQYTCLYYKHWHIKIRGKCCSNIYGAYSDYYDIQLMCPQAK